VILHAVLERRRQPRGHTDLVTHGELFLLLQRPNEQKYERLGVEETVELLQATTHALVHLQDEDTKNTNFTHNNPLTRYLYGSQKTGHSFWKADSRNNTYITFPYGKS